MNTKKYQQVQNLRKQLHESKKIENKNESSNEAQKINEQLISMSCGTKQINS